MGQQSVIVDFEFFHTHGVQSINDTGNTTGWLTRWFGNTVLREQRFYAVFRNISWFAGIRCIKCRERTDTEKICKYCFLSHDKSYQITDGKRCAIWAPLTGSNRPMAAPMPTAGRVSLSGASSIPTLSGALKY